MNGLNSRKRKTLLPGKKARASVAAADCYIFGAADGLPEKLEIKKEDLVIFCDGGLKYADRVQKEKCFLFGDLDSMETEMRKELFKTAESTEEKSNSGKEELNGQKEEFENISHYDQQAVSYHGKELKLRLFPVRKDDTDTALALKYALKKNCERIFFYGCCGGDRPDHFLANLALLSFTAAHGKQAFLYDGRYSYTMIGNGAGSADTEIGNSAGKHYSCFAYGGNVTGLSLTGFEYEAEDITLLKDVSLGAGNTIKGDTAKISIKTGQLLIVTETEPNKVIQ